MNTLVVYDSKFGNTQKVAEAIAQGMGAVSAVQVVSVGDAARVAGTLDGGPDLVIVGGPTQNHGASAGLRDFTDALPASLRGVPAACFDTRYRGPVFLTGSAATVAAKALAKAGAKLVTTPESFFIERRGQMPLQALERGEIERAGAWGRAIAAAPAFAAIAARGGAGAAAG